MGRRCRLQPPLPARGSPSVSCRAAPATCWPATCGCRERARRRRGRCSRRARAAMTLPSVRSAPHRVTVDGTAQEIRAAMLLVLNCGQLPPGFLKLRADLSPDDGWLDVVALDADGALQSATAVMELFLGRGRNGKGRRVWWARGRTVRVEVPDSAPRPVQLDGDVTGETPFEARLLPGALSVLVGPAFKAHHG